MSTITQHQNQQKGPTHDIRHVMDIFNRLFQDSEKTILVKGDGEPLYLPRSAEFPYNRVIFAHGYFASALHEVAHWCIAGKKRRLLEDYGYWYKPDGRSAEEQRAFENAEVKPQALEWIFSRACGFPFVFSADNLTGSQTDMDRFERDVAAQVDRYIKVGLPKRAKRFTEALENFHSRIQVLSDQSENRR